VARALSIAMMLETTGPGGAEVVLLQLSDELRRRGHQVHVIGPDRRSEWLQAKVAELGFPWREYRIRRALDPACLRGLIATLRELRVDLVHGHEFTMGVYGAAAARWLGIPYAISIHGNQSVTEAWRRRVALRWAFRGSVGVAAVSQHTRQVLLDHLGIPPESVQLVHNGIPYRPGQRERIRQELALGPDEVLILSVGSLRPRKGHRVLLDAAARLERFGLPTPWRVAIAGAGEEREALEAVVRVQGLSHRVHLLGQREDIPDLQAAADVFALASYWEGLPLAVLEGMFGGNAIVSTNVGGVAEAVTHGEHGLLTMAGDSAALADALRVAISDRALRERWGRAARHRAESSFQVGVMAQAYERLYQGHGPAAADRPSPLKSPGPAPEGVPVPPRRSPARSE
jgi:glycosyltransferase involved in cell wall biosynthesis